MHPSTITVCASDIKRTPLRGWATALAAVVGFVACGGPVFAGPGTDLSVTATATGEDQVPGMPGLIFDISNPPAFPEAPNYGTSATHATAGRRIAYSIVVSNIGGADAFNVVVQNRLPAGVTIVPGTLAADILDAGDVLIGSGACNAGSPGDAVAVMECGVGTIGIGGRAVISFHVLVGPGASPGSVLVHDTIVTSDTPDSVNTNDRAVTKTIVNTWADMVITMLSVGENVTGYDNDLRRHIIEDLPGQVTAGRELRYEITVQNNGASDAQNVQILNLLPGQTSTGLDHDPVILVSTDGNDCQPLTELQELGIFNAGGGQFGQVLWCNLGEVPAGARRTLHILASVDSSVPDGTTLTNGAFVWWGPSTPPAQPGGFSGFPFPQIPPELPTTDDPLPDDNFASTDSVVNAVADVYIRKLDMPAADELDQPFEPDLALAGNEHRYLVTIGNEGPSVARDVNVQDFLDFMQFGILGETFLRCEPFDIDDFVSCSESNGVVDLDLMLKQNEQIVPGDIDSGEEFSFYLIVEIDPGYALDADDFVVTNDSRITTTTTDFHTANNVDAHDSLIVGEADLMVEMTDDLDGADPTPGGTVTYEITVTNLSPSDAAEVLLTNYLPADGFVLDPSLISVSIDGVLQTECLDELDAAAGDVCFVNDNGRIELILGNDPDSQGANEIGRMNVGSTTVVTIEVQVGDDDLDGILVNEAWVETRGNDVSWPPAPDLVPGVGGGPRTPTPDADLANNYAALSYAVDDVADLRIVKFGKPDDEVQAGEELTYTVIVDNLGPDAATGVAVKDLMQSNGSFDVLSIDSDRPMTCNSLPAADEGNPFNVPATDGAATSVSERYQLDCTLADSLEVLQADGPPNTGRWVITVRVRAKERQTINNVADVLSDELDPNLSNNHADVEHAITEAADLAIEKTADIENGRPNGAVEYRLRVTNNGPSTATNVIVTDILPGGFSIVGVASSQGACAPGTPGNPADPTRCNLGTLASGDVATIVLEALLPPGNAAAEHVNRATVVADQYDPNNANNLATATVAVVPPPPPDPDPTPDMTPSGCGFMTLAPMLATIAGIVGLGRRVRRRR